MYTSVPQPGFKVTSWPLCIRHSATATTGIPMRLTWHSKGTPQEGCDILHGRKEIRMIQETFIINYSNNFPHCCRHPQLGWGALTKSLIMLTSADDVKGSALTKGGDAILHAECTLIPTTDRVFLLQNQSVKSETHDYFPPGCPGTHFVDQSGLRDLPASAS